MSVRDDFHLTITGPQGDAERAAAPKLVFLHGVMGYSANWRRIARAFENEFEVLVFDQRGHGRSFHPDSGYAPEDYAGDLIRILEELRWDRVHLIGHSMGGRVALHFASTHPTRVTRLVIEDIGPSMLQAGASYILGILDAVPIPFKGGKREAKEWFDVEFMRLFASERMKEGLAAFLYANVIENERKEAVWRFHEPGVRESIAHGRGQERWDEVRALTMPTLLVRGEFSRDLPRPVFERVLTENQRIEGVEIKGAGHWVHSDAPDLFIRVLQRFFRGERQTAEVGIEPKVL